MLDTVESARERARPRRPRRSRRGDRKDPRQALVGFEVATRWTGQTRSETKVDGFTWVASASPAAQDRRRRAVRAARRGRRAQSAGAADGAFNACMMVGYVAGRSLKGITLDSLEIQTRGHSTCAASSGLSDSVARLREHRLCRDDQGRRLTRGVRGNPPDGDEDVAQLLQHEPADPDERTLLHVG